MDCKHRWTTEVIKCADCRKVVPPTNKTLIGTCGDCRYWSNGQTCKSTDQPYYGLPELPEDFGCIHWKEKDKKLDVMLRVRLAKGCRFQTGVLWIEKNFGSRRDLRLWQCIDFPPIKGNLVSWRVSSHPIGLDSEWIPTF